MILSGSTLFRCALALAALAAAGCALKVNQEKEVAKYRSIVEPRDQKPPSFVPGQSVTLEQAMLLANEYNERIGLQGEAYLQSIIARDRAAAAFLPTISLNPTYTANEQANTSGLNTSGGKKDFTDVPVTGRMNVFNGFSDVETYLSAGRTIQERRALLLDAQAALLIDVASTYYQVLRAEQSVLVLQQTLEAQEARVRDMQARRVAGLVKQLDVAQSEAQAASTRVSLLNARNAVVNARTVLSFLIGVDVSTSPLTDAAEAAPSVPPIDQLQETAQLNRQDLAAARASVEAARLAVNAAIGQYFPSVSINANYWLSRETPPSANEWTALINVNVPIFTAGIIEANIRAAWSVFRQQVLLEHQTRRQVIQDVGIAYENLTASRERLRELRVQLRAAQEAFDLAQARYRAELATNLDVLTAQDAVLSAQLQLTSEIFNQKVFYLTLLRAMGTLSTRLPGEATTLPTTQPVIPVPAPPTTQP